MSHHDPNTSRSRRRCTLDRRDRVVARCVQWLAKADRSRGPAKFKPSDVKCPDGVKAEVGVTFDCTFTGPDANYVAHMKILAVNGDAVQFDVNSEPVK